MAWKRGRRSTRRDMAELQAEISGGHREVGRAHARREDAGRKPRHAQHARTVQAGLGTIPRRPVRRLGQLMRRNYYRSWWTFGIGLAVILVVSVVRWLGW
jgi:hypothetical protein